MKPEPGYLGRSAERDVAIDVDRPCLDCGYNLRGLRSGGRCPECGSPISRTTRGDAPLSRMPLSVIRAFRGASWLAVGCVAAVAGSSWFAFFGSAPPVVVRAVVISAGLGWFVAMFLLTPAIPVPQAISRGFTEAGVTRRIARWAQLGWLLAAGALIAPSMWSGSALAAAATGAFYTGVLIGTVGMVAMAVMMERLAEWTRDTTAEWMFQWFQWALPILVIMQLVPMILPLLSFVLSLVALIGVLLFPIGMLLLTKSITLSAIHWGEDQARDHRRAERRARERAELAARLDAMDRAREQTPHPGAQGGERG